MNSPPSGGVRGGQEGSRSLFSQLLYAENIKDGKVFQIIVIQISFNISMTMIGMIFGLEYFLLDLGVFCF